MEEKINHIFDEKMMTIKDFSKKNNIKMNNIKHELKLTILKLKSDMNKLSIAELKSELKNMKAQKIALANEICDLKNDLQTLNNLCGEDYKRESKMNIKDILFSSSDHELFKSYFKDIGQATKNIQDQLRNT